MKLFQNLNAMLISNPQTCPQLFIMLHYLYAMLTKIQFDFIGYGYAANLSSMLHNL